MDIYVMVKHDKNSVAYRVQQRMEALNLNPNATAIKAGMDRTNVQNILYGKSKNPRADTLSKLATALECSVSWLSTGEGTPSPETTSSEEFQDYSDEKLDIALDLIADAMEELDVKLEVKVVARLALKLLSRAYQNIEKLGPGIAHILVEEASQNE